MTRRPEARQEGDTRRIAWISGAYGYGDDLVYFADVFAQFLLRFPNGLIPVAQDYPVERYPELTLVPMLGFHTFGRAARTVGGITYTSVRRIPTVATLLRMLRLRADAFILIEFSPTSLVGFFAAKLTRRRTVLLIESDPSYRGAPGGRNSLMIKRFVAKRVDVVLVSNVIGAAFVSDVLRVNAGKTVVGPYLTSCPPPPATGLSSADADAGAPGVMRMLFLNSITARKGLVQLIDALAAVAIAERGRWLLDVVGSGSELEAIRAHADDAGLSGNIIFHGRAAYADTGRYYAGADLVICPTLADYRSLGGFEAVNAGKPVLISQYDGAHHEILEYAPGARLIDPQDRAAFTRVLEEYILDDSALAAALLAATAVPAQFSLAAVAENLRRAVMLALAE